jgi:HTH-type transcriptional repressor of NAD biosynthesis genes
MLLTTPDKITPQITRLCNEIAEGSTPVMVPVVPAQGSQVNDCFEVARLYAEQHGGQVQYGWMIFELQEIMLEAHFHAVWCSPSNEFVDVTPKQDGEQQILFLPDSSRHYFGRNHRPYLKALGPEPIIEEFISLSERVFQIEIDNTIESDGEVLLSLTPQLHAEREAILARKAAVIPMLNNLCLKLKTSKQVQSKNSPCHCGSGQKYKKCHGTSISA